MARRAIVERGNLYTVFMSMLASFGGSFEPKDKRRKRQEKEETSSLRSGPLTMGGMYSKDSRGIITRRTPKRDKSISARQWKRQQRSARRSGVAA